MFHVHLKSSTMCDHVPQSEEKIVHGTVSQDKMRHMSMTSSLGQT